MRGHLHLLLSLLGFSCCGTDESFSGGAGDSPATGDTDLDAVGDSGLHSCQTLEGCPPGQACVEYGEGECGTFTQSACIVQPLACSPTANPYWLACVCGRAAFASVCDARQAGHGERTYLCHADVVGDECDPRVVGQVCADNEICVLIADSVDPDKGRCISLARVCETETSDAVCPVDFDGKMKADFCTHDACSLFNTGYRGPVVFSR